MNIWISSLDVEQQSSLEKFVEKFDKAWSDFEEHAPSILEHLPPDDDPFRWATAWELVLSDLDFRSRNELEICVEDYIVLFPDTEKGRVSADLYLAEYEALDEAGSQIIPQSEFLSRLPEDAVSVLAGKLAPFKRFRLGEVIGRGGTSDIYTAFDRELKKTVAFKRLRSVDPQTESLFAREVSITSAMDHPGIVPIYGTMLSDEGRFGYAMMLIGEPEVDGCRDARELNSWLKKPRTMRDLISWFHRHHDADWKGAIFRKWILGSFIEVCKTINYAHDHRNVIHRDLKPDNIMVSLNQQTYVMDWGFAVEIGSADAVNFVGTPAYISPEQLEGQPASKSSDIYAIGVILLEVLSAGTFKPSDNINQPVDDHTALIEQCKRLHAPKPLISIGIKATARDPEKRYETPNALLQQIENWLELKKVEDHRETFFESIQRSSIKYANWTLASLATALIAAGILSYSYFAVSKYARNEATAKRQAIEERTQAKKSRDDALKEKENAEKAKKVSEDVLQWLRSSFDFAEWELNKDKLISAKSVLESANRNKSILSDKNARLLAMDVIGRANLGIGEYENAVSVYNDAIALSKTMDHVLVDLEIINSNLAIAHFENGSFEAARKILEQSDSQENSGSMTSVSDAANLARIYQKTGSYLKALKIHEDLLLNANKDLLDPIYQHLLFNYSTVLHDLGRYAEAKENAQLVFENRRQLLGDDSIKTIQAKLLIADNELKLGNFRRGKKLIEEAIVIQKEKLGEQHIDTIMSHSALANALIYLRQFPKAEQILRSAIRLMEGGSSREHYKKYELYNNLAVVLQNQKKMTEAISYFEKSAVSHAKVLGRQNINSLVAAKNFANALSMIGKHQESIKKLTTILSMMKEHFGENAKSTAECRNTLGLAHYRAGQFQDAREVFENAKNAIGSNLVELQATKQRTLNMLGVTLRELGLFKDSISAFRECLEISSALQKPNVLFSLMKTNIELPDFDAAREYGVASVNAYREIATKDSLALANILSNRGWQFMRINDFETARRLFDESFEINGKLNPSEYKTELAKLFRDYAITKSGTSTAFDEIEESLSKLEALGKRLSNKELDYIEIIIADGVSHFRSASESAKIELWERLLAAFSDEISN